MEKSWPSRVRKKRGKFLSIKYHIKGRCQGGNWSDADGKKGRRERIISSASFERENLWRKHLGYLQRHPQKEGGEKGVGLSVFPRVNGVEASREEFGREPLASWFSGEKKGRASPVLNNFEPDVSKWERKDPGLGEGEKGRKGPWADHNPAQIKNKSDTYS